ncbi:MAG: carbon storage regulator CsrA [Candidatus Cloacimonetes bacterium]|nr:carbon storage regulator CsrA [Candidatus Cloacimonadota bacterium]
MLVLTRKKNQKIMIGDSIELTIVEIKNEQIKIGVDAPSHVKVFRKEVYDAIQEENRAASSMDGITPESLKGLSDLFKS